MPEEKITIEMTVSQAKHLIELLNSVHIHIDGAVVFAERAIEQARKDIGSYQNMIIAEIRKLEPKPAPDEQKANPVEPAGEAVPVPSPIPELVGKKRRRR